MITFKTSNQRGDIVTTAAVCIAIVLVITAVVVVKRAHHTTNADACTNQVLSSGDSGKCVGYAQTLANWVAYGIDGTKYTKVTNTFDSSTVKTVKQAQVNSRLISDGTVNKTTWKQLCDNRDAPANVIEAAKNAGC